MHLDHIGIAVASITEARPLYEQGLGLELYAAEEEVAGEKVRVLKLRCSGQSNIELIEACSPDSTIARFIAQRGPGIHHLCFHTDTLASDIARMQALGYRPLWDAPRTGAGGCLVMFFHPRDTGGTLIELSQPA